MSVLALVIGLALVALALWRRVPAPGVDAVALHQLTFEIRRADGSVRERWRCRNLIVTTGLNYLFDSGYRTNALYLMPISATPTVAAGDTMASHAGWTEVTTYTEATRQVWTLSATSGGAANNNAAPAVVTNNSGGVLTLGGAAIVTNSTKAGTSGTLVGVAPFIGGNKSWANTEKFCMYFGPSLANAP